MGWYYSFERFMHFEKSSTIQIDRDSVTRTEYEDSSSSEYTDTDKNTTPMTRIALK